MTKRFNVRIYGILIENNKVLVSDEFIRGRNITKLPGGGLEFGEGVIDCLIREFKEELQIDINVKHHFYTTDFFVASAFDSNSQVISIYYVVESPQTAFVKTTLTPFDYVQEEGAQAMRWINLSEISGDDFTLIIDKKIGDLLKEQYSN